MKDRPLAHVELYTKAACSYCLRAKRLLDEKGVAYTDHDITLGGPKRHEMLARSAGGTTVPQIFIGGRRIGGGDDLMALERAGKLDALLAE